MADCVAIAPELSFRNQVFEPAMHLGRIIARQDQQVYREYTTAFDAHLRVDEGQEDFGPEQKQDIVRYLITKVTEAEGGLGGAKENDAEASHLLIQYVLSSNFDVTSTEYATLVKTVIQAIKVGAGRAATEGRQSRLEAASRILNNNYNYLPANSPLRPTTLLALLSVLALAGDLESLPLSGSFINSSLNEWAISNSEKIAFLVEASEIYQTASLASKALELNLVALNLEASEQVAERAVALTLASENKYDLGDVLKTPGVTGKISGKAAELARLFTETDELEAVGQGQQWAQANASYITGFNIPKFSSESVVRKLRLIALATLCARSASKQVTYAEVAQALAVPETEVEAWVIDAIRANLIKARLSQPASLVKIQSVSSAGTRRFGSDEWQTLERRLQEWKKSVSEARSVIAEAEAVAAQGPITHQRRGQGQEQQQKRGGEEEVAA